MGTPTRWPNGINNAAKGSALVNLPAQDPTKLVEYFNDFHTYTAGDFTITETGVGTRALTAAKGGALLITNAAADNDNNQFQLVAESFTLASGNKAWFKARFKVSDATQSDVAIGLMALDTDVFSAADGDGVTDGIFFWKDDGDAIIDFQVQKDATTGQLRQTAVGTLVDDTYKTVGFEWDGQRYVTVYVDDVKVYTMDLTATPSTYLPNANLTVTFAIKNGAGAAKTMTVDYVYAAQER